MTAIVGVNGSGIAAIVLHAIRAVTSGRNADRRREPAHRGPASRRYVRLREIGAGKPRAQSRREVTERGARAGQRAARPRTESLRAPDRPRPYEQLADPLV